MTELPIDAAQDESWLAEHMAYALEALDGELTGNPDMSYREQAEFLMSRPGVDLEARIRRLLQKWADDLEGYPVKTDPAAQLAARVVELSADEVKQVLEGAEPEELGGLPAPPSPDALAKLMSTGLRLPDELKREMTGEWKPLIADHEFEPGHTGMTCERMVLDEDGSGTTCGGTPADHGLKHVVAVDPSAAGFTGPMVHFLVREDGTVYRTTPL